ncbi:hypothetical protein [Psychromonas aquatilis]|uniref:Uncharacterized protein n=1 Tax=Psychromonas aquatilis TaxID=2005072 RepID=A0ABU9GRJ1_9GAMM
MFNYKSKGVVKSLIIFFVAVFNSSAMAADSFQAERLSTIGSLYTLATIVASFLGLFLIIIAIYKLKLNSDNPNISKNFPSSIVITFLAGTLLFNYAGSSSVIIKSVLGDDSGYCMLAIEEQIESETVRENCFDVENSEMLADTATKIEEMNGEDASQVFKNNIKVIISFFQFVGFIYFVKSIYSLKRESEGQSNQGYGKIIGTIFLSSLFIDLPHTLVLIDDTMNYLGFGL